MAYDMQDENNTSGETRKKTWYDDVHRMEEK